VQGAIQLIKANTTQTPCPGDIVAASNCQATTNPRCESAILAKKKGMACGKGCIVGLAVTGGLLGVASSAFVGVWLLRKYGADRNAIGNSGGKQMTSSIFNMKEAMRERERKKQRRERF
jgi:hypothetical protein